jgi:hypothetical protein
MSQQNAEDAKVVGKGSAQMAVEQVLLPEPANLGALGSSSAAPTPGLTEQLRSVLQTQQETIAAQEERIGLLELESTWLKYELGVYEDLMGSVARRVNCLIARSNLHQAEDNQLTLLESRVGQDDVDATLKQVPGPAGRVPNRARKNPACQPAGVADTGLGASMATDPTPKKAQVTTRAGRVSRATRVPSSEHPAAAGLHQPTGAPTIAESSSSTVQQVIEVLSSDAEEGARGAVTEEDSGGEEIEDREMTADEDDDSACP